MSDEIPEGWSRADLGSLIHPSKKKVEPGEARGRPYLGLEHIESETNRIAAKGNSSEVKSTMVVFSPGDVLFSKLRPYLNKVAVAPFEGVGSSEILVFEQCPHLDSKYLMWLLSRREVARIANDRASGVQLPRVTFDKIADVEVPIAPLPEQHRIVEKVEVLLEQVNRAKERLDRVPLILKRFRQAVLAAACSGELTREWRSGQPASAGAKVCSHSIELPQSWSCDVMSSATDYMGGFAFPSGAFSKQPTNHQVIRIGNVRPRGLDLNAAPVFINDEEALRAERFRLDAGDVLVSMTGTRFKRDYGYPAQVTGVLPELYLNQRVARLRPRNNCTSQYLTLWMETDLFREFFFSGETGNVNQGNVGADAVKLGPIHLPPMEEQTEVARQVDRLMALISVVERRLTVASAHAQRLPQAIFSKAFSGELVPTEAELARLEGRTYETAEELLKRVTALGSDAPSARKGRGRRTG